LQAGVHGEMDFKVAGTKSGITAIQMDLKNDGLTHEIIKEALEITRDARFAILDEIMLKAIPQPREDVSDWAPKMTTMMTANNVATLWRIQAFAVFIRAQSSPDTIRTAVPSAR